MNVAPQLFAALPSAHVTAQPAPAHVTVQLPVHCTVHVPAFVQSMFEPSPALTVQARLFEQS